MRLKDLHLSAEMQHHGWQPGLSLWLQLSPRPPQDDHMSTGKQPPLQLHSSLAVNDFLSGPTSAAPSTGWTEGFKQQSQMRIKKTFQLLFLSSVPVGVS